MSHFVVPNCEVRACNNWRPGNTCLKHLTPINLISHVTSTMQNAEICEVHRQYNTAKLENLIEGK